MPQLQPTLVIHTFEDDHLPRLIMEAVGIPSHIWTDIEYKVENSYDIAVGESWEDGERVTVYQYITVTKGNDAGSWEIAVSYDDRAEKADPADMPDAFGFSIYPDGKGDMVLDFWQRAEDEDAEERAARLWAFGKALPLRVKVS